jgi:hypothetical protein
MLLFYEFAGKIKGWHHKSPLLIFSNIKLFKAGVLPTSLNSINKREKVSNRQPLPPNEQTGEGQSFF